MTSIDESARPADSADIDVVAALVEQATVEIEPHRGGAVWARREARVRPAADGLHQALIDEAQLLVVGTIDDSVVGYAVTHREELHDETLLAVVDDIYVLPDARGVGVGEAMLDLCLEWATSGGCIGLDSLALPGDRQTKNFFESFGLVARAIIVHRRLDEHA